MNENETQPAYFDDFEITHKANPQKLTVSSWAEYYAFGKVAKASCSGAGSYRYGYQGEFAEKDQETEWNSFELRQYDSEIGRFTTTDPMGEFWSSYVGMGNDPVNLTDPTGGETSDIIYLDKNNKQIGREADQYGNSRLTYFKEDANGMFAYMDKCFSLVAGTPGLTAQIAEFMSTYTPPPAYSLPEYELNSLGQADLAMRKWLYNNLGGFSLGIGYTDMKLGVGGYNYTYSIAVDRNSTAIFHTANYVAGTPTSSGWGATASVMMNENGKHFSIHNDYAGFGNGVSVGFRGLTVGMFQPTPSQTGLLPIPWKDKDRAFTGYSIGIGGSKPSLNYSAGETKIMWNLSSIFNR